MNMNLSPADAWVIGTITCTFIITVGTILYTIFNK